MGPNSFRRSHSSEIPVRKIVSEPLTIWFSLNFEVFKVEQDLVFGLDIDEPVALEGAPGCARGVLLRVVGAGDDAVIVLCDVAAAFN